MMPRSACGLQPLRTLARIMLITSGRWFMCVSCRVSGIRIKASSKLPFRLEHRSGSMHSVGIYQEDPRSQTRDPTARRGRLGHPSACNEAAAVGETDGLVDLWAIQGEPHLETGGMRLRLHGDRAKMLGQDPSHQVEPKSEPLPERLGGEEGLEDACRESRVDAHAIIPNIDERHLTLQSSDQLESAMPFCGVDGVLDERGPYLAQFSTVCSDGRHARLVVTHDHHLLQLWAEQGESVFQRLDQIDVLDRSLVHVGVILDGVDDVKDAAR